MPTDRQRTAAFNAARREQLKQALAIRKDTYAELLRLLGVAREDVARILAGAPTEYQAWSLPQLQRAIDAALGELAARESAALGAGLSASWQAGVDLVDQPLAAGGVRVSGLLPAVEVAQLEGMRSFTTHLITSATTALQDRITSELGLTLIGSQSVGETVAKVQALVDGSRSRALTITRTELGRATSTATQVRLEQAAPILPELRKQWRRSGKVHSRLRHDAIDGQIQPVDKPFVLPGGIEIMHPKHPAAPAGETINCGCESLPYMDGWPAETPGARAYSTQELLRKGFLGDARPAPQPGWANP